MGRTIRTYQMYAPAPQIFDALSRYLSADGFSYIQEDGESVFLKSGLFSCPLYVKPVFQANTMQLEIWIKYVLLPGVAISEFPIDDGKAMAAAVKASLRKKFIPPLDAMLYQNGAQFVQTQVRTTEMMMQSLPNAAQQPYVNAQQPYVNAQQPYVNAQQPYANAQQPYVNAQQPYVNAQQPYVNAQQPYVNAQQPYANAAPAGGVTDKKAFLSADAAFNRDVRSAAIACYVCAGLSAVAAIGFGAAEDTLVIPWDSLLLLAPTLGMHLGKNKVCAYLILALAILEVILSLALELGSVPYLWIAAGIWSVVTFSKADKRYQAYLASCGTPQTPGNNYMQM